MRRALKWVAIAFGAWVGLVVLVGIGLVLKVIRSPPVPPGRYAPPQQGAAQNRAPEPSRIPHIGEIVVANRASFCGSTPAAFDEMMTWATRREWRR